MDFLGIGWGELILIIIIALIFLGPGKIVEFSKTLGRAVRAIKKVSSDFSSTVTKEMEAEEKNLSTQQPAKHNDTTIQQITLDPTPPKSKNSNKPTKSIGKSLKK